MDIHNAIARWEDEGGAIPQVLRQGFKALTAAANSGPDRFFTGVAEDAALCKKAGPTISAAKLHLVHVVPPPPALLPRRAALPLNFSEELIADAGERLRKLAAEFSFPARPKAVLGAHRRDCRGDQQRSARDASGTHRDCDPRPHRT